MISGMASGPRAPADAAGEAVLAALEAGTPGGEPRRVHPVRDRVGTVIDHGGRALRLGVRPYAAAAPPAGCVRRAQRGAAGPPGRP